MTRTIRSLTALVTVFAVFLAAFGLLTALPSVSAAKMGDLDNDGALTTTDIRLCMQGILNNNFSTTQKKLADYDGNGTVGSADSRSALKDILSGKADEVVRSFWITYMEINDMLSSGNVTTARNAISACLEDCAAKGTNTVYFHTRAFSDAYYASSVYTPNSRTQTLLNKGFDPLAYAVERAHQLGMKIEAWINPYRIGSTTANAKVSDYFKFGSLYYYVPSSKAVQDLVVRGVREVVQNYDIDGVQFDDYFYPRDSVSATATSSFESGHYNTYKANGGTLGVSDWRRSVVNDLVRACWSACHEREGCVFGISPSCNISDNYNKMYADAEAWLKTPGYIDYLAPQLYVGYNNKLSFETCLAQFDNMQRHGGVKMVAGLALYKTGLKEDEYAGDGIYEWANNNDIMERQCATTKDMHWDGIAYYSHGSYEIESNRNATIAKADMASATVAWLIFK